MIVIGTLDASGGPPPDFVYGSITHGADGNFRVDGGGLAILNVLKTILCRLCHPRIVPGICQARTGPGQHLGRGYPIPPFPPLYTLHTQAPDLDIVLYLNGIVRDKSRDIMYPIMMILNTRTGDFRTVNLESVVLFSVARVGAIFQYLPISSSIRLQRWIDLVCRHNKT
jgi:hypothetical protein